MVLDVIYERDVIAKYCDLNYTLHLNIALTLNGAARSFVVQDVGRRQGLGASRDV